MVCRCSTRSIAYGDGAVSARASSEMLGLGPIATIRPLRCGDGGRRGAGHQPRSKASMRQAAIPPPSSPILPISCIWVTRLKVVPDAVAMPRAARSKDARPGLCGARRHGASVAGLADAAQGASRKPNCRAMPLMAAEMVLIRLAYAAELPSGEDLVALARSGGSRRAPAAPRPSPAPQAADAERTPSSAARSPSRARPRRRRARPQERNAVLSPRSATSSRLPANGATSSSSNSSKRWCGRSASQPGQIELALEPNAPQGLAKSLQRKLEAWTGARWMVVVARDGGDKPLAQQARDRREGLFMEAREHPDVQRDSRAFSRR